MRRSKYHAKTTVIEGKAFDSRKEARRWKELQLLQRAGAISDLQTQVKYVLIPAQRGPDGKVIEREASYYADFVYTEAGKLVVEDAKGVRTPAYILKRKLMLERYGIRIRET